MTDAMDNFDEQDADLLGESAPQADAAEALARERDELMGRLQRISADYLNYQKRVDRERRESRDFVIAELAAAFAEVLDDLELAVTHARENHSPDDPLLAGTSMVYGKAVEMLKRFGVEQVATEGESFDPARHEALQMQPTDAVEPMTILHELRKGYALKERIIRPARVIVATAPPEPSEPQPDQPQGE